MVSVLLSGELKEEDEDVGGTLEYMAPEIRRGDDPDARADLYAFGSTRLRDRSRYVCETAELHCGLLSFTPASGQARSTV